jgi:hypothetical protein
MTLIQGDPWRVHHLRHVRAYEAKHWGGHWAPVIGYWGDRWRLGGV